jgi:hypothetical protein
MFSLTKRIFNPAPLVRPPQTRCWILKDDTRKVVGTRLSPGAEVLERLEAAGKLADDTADL